MYVVYLRGRDGHDAKYWAGGFRRDGDPSSSDYTDGGLQFATARAAYDEAGKYPRLRFWHVGKRAGGRYSQEPLKETGPSQTGRMDTLE